MRTLWWCGAKRCLTKGWRFHHHVLQHVRQRYYFDQDCWRVSLHVSICGVSKGGYTTSAGTDGHHQMWKTLFVTMTTSSSGRLSCYPDRRKLNGTRRQTSVHRTDTQTSKVWTIQMMTLILTPALHVKRNFDWVSSRVLINTYRGVYWNCQYIYMHIQELGMYLNIQVLAIKIRYLYSVLVWNYA